MTSEPRANPPAPPPPPEPLSETARLFILLLWRRPIEWEERENARTADAEGLARRVIGSIEFRELFTRVRTEPVPPHVLARIEPELQRLGTDEEFVTQAYAALFGRAVDESGHSFYCSYLASGNTRAAVLTGLFQSHELAERRTALSPGEPFVPRDVQLCELVNPAKWDNPEWLALLTSLAVVPPDKASMHRKGYEFTQLAYGLTRLGRLRPGSRVLSVGAGHEAVLYWLANRVRHVVATDLYSGAWQAAGAMEGDRGVLADPKAYAPFQYRTERLAFTEMDGRMLGFREHAFDVVYSLSSIEHFGGLSQAKAAVAEMVRVLVPGGLFVLATDYCLDGSRHHEAFQPEEVHHLLQHPQLRLVQPIDETVWQRYEYKPVDMAVNPNLTPHLVVRDRGALFTSVIAFLERV